MSFKTAIKKIQDMFKKQTSDEEKMQKYENVLQQLVDRAEWVHSTATKSTLPCLYIYAAPSVNIDTLQETYADLGIKLEKHVSHLNNKKCTVLYISTQDFMKLDAKQQKILSLPTEKNYKRKIELSAKRGRIR